MQSSWFTSSRPEFCLGFFERDDREPSQILVLKDVGYGSPFPSPRSFRFLQSTVHSAGSSGDAQFTPILAGYIVAGFQENAILKARIRAPVLFQEDLTRLRPITNWKLTYDADTGSYKIEPDNTI